MTLVTNIQKMCSSNMVSTRRETRFYHTCALGRVHRQFRTTGTSTNHS
jgi:hypothetical protein